MKKIILSALALTVALSACNKEKTCTTCKFVTTFRNFDNSIPAFKIVSETQSEECRLNINEVKQLEYDRPEVVDSVTYEDQDTLRYNNLKIPLVNGKVRVTRQYVCPELH